MAGEDSACGSKTSDPPDQKSTHEQLVAMAMRLQSEMDGIKSIIFMLRPVIEFRQIKTELESDEFDPEEIRKRISLARDWLLKVASSPEFIQGMAGDPEALHVHTRLLAEWRESHKGIEEDPPPDEYDPRQFFLYVYNEKVRAQMGKQPLMGEPIPLDPWEMREGYDRLRMLLPFINRQPPPEPKPPKPQRPPRVITPDDPRYNDLRKKPPIPSTTNEASTLTHGPLGPPSGLEAAGDLNAPPSTPTEIPGTESSGADTPGQEENESPDPYELPVSPEAMARIDAFQQQVMELRWEERFKKGPLGSTGAASAGSGPCPPSTPSTKQDRVVPSEPASQDSSLCPNDDRREEEGKVWI